MNNWISEPFVLVTGIANPQPMIDFLKHQNANFEHIKYPDHHHFSENEIAFLNTKKRILTTEKDFVRLSQSLGEKLFYLPIQMFFPNPNEEKDFKEWLKNEVK